MKSNKSGLNQANRWLIAAIVGIVVYGFSQPYLNAMFGWQLPSIASLAGEATPLPGDDSASGSVQTGSTNSSATDRTASADQVATKEVEPGVGKAAGKDPAVDEQPDTQSLDPLTEYLKETPPGSENYVSPEGLRYTRGSEEGHRIKHLERHLKDQPNRPGKHGVFNGDLLQVLRLLDEAYVRGKKRGKGTSQRTEDGRTVYEVTFDQAIGYVGGQAGGRDGKPKAKQIRLVVERDRVITAFPF